MSDYPSQNPEEPSADQAPKESQADRLIKLVKRKDIELFHDQYEDCWARIRFRDHSEIRKCRSRDFRRYLGLIYWQEYRKAPSSQTLSDATNVIESVARYEGECHALFNRVAWHEGRLYYDLADSKRRAVCITPEGWSIDDDPPILFRRYTHQKAQVAPESRGDLKSVLPFLNLRDESSERLVLVYLVSLFVPDIAHPISIIHGPQGAAKTTFLRCLRRMVDPSVTETLSLPSKLPELVQQLAHHWMPVFDNISKLPEWLSDDLCRACTGAGVSKRELYTDDDDIIYSFRRCVALNGINIVAQKADLLDRSLLFGLKAIQESARKPEADFWNDYEDALPYLLGAVFDVLSDQRHNCARPIAPNGRFCDLGIRHQPSPWLRSTELPCRLSGEHEPPQPGDPSKFTCGCSCDRVHGGAEGMGGDRNRTAFRAKQDRGNDPRQDQGSALAEGSE